MLFLAEELYYFINAVIQTLHISNFILVYVDILHIVNIVMLRCVSPAPRKKCTFVTKKHISHSF